jgi:dynein light intermediate chain 1
MIILDWTSPHTFVDQLLLWLGWLDTWSRGDNSREAQLAREDSREKCTSYSFLIYRGI